MRTTSAEHGTDERAPARAASEAQRRDTALPMHARMLLGLQATAGNAAVADLIETHKPAISPPTLAEGGLGDEAAPVPVTAEAPPSEEATVDPRAGETDDELAALDAEADTTASISPPTLGESSLGDGEAGDVPEAPGGGADITARIIAPMPGKVVRVLVEAGAEVETGAGIVVVEAMKMQNEMKSPKAGIVATLNVEVGTTVNGGDVLAVIE